MKRLTFIAILCCLTGISVATFELSDPAEIAEDINTPSQQEDSHQVVKAGDSEVIVPMGTNLYQPAIENNTCAALISDFSEPGSDGATGSTTSETYIGVIIRSIECPTDDSMVDKTQKIALVKTGQGRLIWVDSTKILDSK